MARLKRDIMSSLQSREYPPNPLAPPSGGSPQAWRAWEQAHLQSAHAFVHTQMQGPPPRPHGQEAARDAAVAQRQGNLRRLEGHLQDWVVSMHEANNEAAWRPWRSVNGVLGRWSHQAAVSSANDSSYAVPEDFTIGTRVARQKRRTAKKKAVGRARPKTGKKRASKK